MKSSWHKRYTVDNNLNATNNLLAAIVEANIDVHVIHLGTMGAYGYGTAGMKIPEGYLGAGSNPLIHIFFSDILFRHYGTVYQNNVSALQCRGSREKRAERKRDTALPL
jgi:nucleoside-diphosphate-sugar epimerase